MNDDAQHNEQFEELCAAYVLGALEAEEQQRFEALLQDADQSQLELYYALRSAANQMAFTMNRATPPAALKQQLMEQVQATAAPRDTHKQDKEEEDGYSRTTLAIAASFALLLISAALIFYTFNLHANLNNKEEIIASQQTQIEALKSDLQRKEELLSIISARSVDLIVMAGMEVNPNGYGKIIWDPEKEQALLQVSNLPPTPAGKDYQLWVIKDNKPIPSGLFAVTEPNEDAFFKIEEMPSVDEQSANAFAITLEPDGGMPQPTGAMYLLGSADE